MLWAQGEISLGLHVITLGVDLGVIWVGGAGRAAMGCVRQHRASGVASSAALGCAQPNSTGECLELPACSWTDLGLLGSMPGQTSQTGQTSQIMWDNGSRVVPIAIIACYGFSHYAMVGRSAFNLVPNPG